jgi:hypothetical protein
VTSSFLRIFHIANERLTISSNGMPDLGLGTGQALKRVGKCDQAVSDRGYSAILYNYDHKTHIIWMSIVDLMALFLSLGTDHKIIKRKNGKQR